MQLNQFKSDKKSKELAGIGSGTERRLVKDTRAKS